MATKSKTLNVTAHQDGKDQHIKFLEQERDNLCAQHAQEKENLRKEYEIRAQNDAARLIKEVERERDEQIKELVDKNREFTENAIKDNLEILALRTLLKEVITKADKIADNFETVSEEDGRIYDEWKIYRDQIPAELYADSNNQETMGKEE